jgi:hypothetical protein
MVAHDIWGASGLEVVLPETVLLCLQRSDAIDVLRDRGIEVFCLAEQVGPEAVAGGSSLDVLAHPATRAFCDGVGPLALMAFKPTERLVTEAAALGAQLIGADPAAARAAENKLAFIELARAAGVRTPRWDSVDRDRISYDELTATFGSPLVLQGPRGNAGQRTWRVASEADLTRALAEEEAVRVRVAEWVEGLPFTATALAGAGGSLPARIEPCRQVTGVDWLTPEPLGSCGNAWPEPRLQGFAVEVDGVLSALARELANRGYDGVFGVDFVLGSDGPLVIEVNPRMVASLPLATQMEGACGRGPLVLRQLIAALGGDIPAPPHEPALPEAAQLIVHDLDGRQVTAPNMAPGVYRLGESEPVRLRDGTWFSDLTAPDEALLLTRSAGESVSPGREFARVYLRQAAAERTPGVRGLVDALRQAPPPRSR